MAVLQPKDFQKEALILCWSAATAVKQDVHGDWAHRRWTVPIQHSTPVAVFLFLLGGLQHRQQGPFVFALECKDAPVRQKTPPLLSPLDETAQRKTTALTLFRPIRAITYNFFSQSVIFLSLPKPLRAIRNCLSCPLRFVFLFSFFKRTICK